MFLPILALVRGGHDRVFHAFVDLTCQARRLEMLNRERFTPNPEAAAASENVMDAWILATLQGLVQVRSVYTWI